MPYEDESIYLLTTMRQAELRAEAAHDRSAQQAAALAPTVGERVVAAARVLGRLWSEGLTWARTIDRRCAERSVAGSWRQVNGVRGGRCEPWRRLSMLRRPTTVAR